MENSQNTPDKKHNPAVNTGDYRPMYLLSNVTKLFEKVIYTSFHFFTLSFRENWISDFQFGFKRSHSTLHGLLKFSNDIILHLRSKISTVAISLDVEKALDTALILRFLQNQRLKINFIFSCGNPVNVFSLT